MGTWGPGIFDDDVAQDVQAAFEENIAQGHDAAVASRRVLDNPPWPLDDEEDEAVTYLALASLQMKYGKVVPAIRNKAIAIIKSGIPMWRWEGLPPGRVAERAQVLKELEMQLLGTQDTNS